MAGCKSVVSDQQFAEKNPYRPAISDDVVNCNEDDMTLGVHPDQVKADQRGSSQIKRTPCQGAQFLSQIRFPGRDLDLAIVEYTQTDGQLRMDPLIGSPARVLLDIGAERFVPLNHSIDCLLQDPGIERCPDVGGFRDVIGKVSRLKLLQQPQPFLGVGQRYFVVLLAVGEKHSLAGDQFGLQFFIDRTRWCADA